MLDILDYSRMPWMKKKKKEKNKKEKGEEEKEKKEKRIVVEERSRGCFERKKKERKGKNPIVSDLSIEGTKGKRGSKKSEKKLLVFSLERERERSVVGWTLSSIRKRNGLTSVFSSGLSRGEQSNRDE